ncbi:MAG TPA: choice-of-anchor tandem repeat GloVer-containing protein [Candidatus Sulfotelmatobacter sp.]|nr:choice-of-anchor tandem repeat GloVer-containing protein [Candidatus Sulfotelmatobacter sp.]
MTPLKAVCIFPLSILFVLVTPLAAQTPSATFTTITDFGEGDGQYPSALAQGLDGNLYGTVVYPHRTGTRADSFFFNLTAGGSYTNLPGYSCKTNYCTGSKPYAGVTLAGDGNFYGTTSYGGNGSYRNVNKSGTLFQANTRSGLTTLYSFCSKLGCQDGDDPYTPLTLGSDGNLYGTTQYGGLHKSGTAFVLTLAGNFNTLHQFCAQTNCADGSYPSGLIQATDGNFYGLAGGGTGAYCGTPNTCGLVFKMTPQGVTTTLYSFCSLPNCTDGWSPQSIIQAADGNLYGATAWSGTTGPGTIFKLSLQGQLKTLYTLCGSTCTTGRTSAGHMIQATDGNFYGISSGDTCCSMVFELTSTGAYSTLYTFCQQGGRYCSDGSGPTGIVQATDGNFYGTTFYGGPSGYGTAFQLSTGLAPFVQTVTSSGAVGASVLILGNNLTGASSVTFNGMAASFTVVSSTEITAAVPKGATTGPIEVITPTGTLKSNRQFAVTGT